MEGLANELDGSILSHGFTTSPFDIEDVLRNWQLLPSAAECPALPVLRLVTAGMWEVDNTITPPEISAICAVSEEEFLQADIVCP
jgi:hypothetical protein